MEKKFQNIFVEEKFQIFLWQKRFISWNIRILSGQIFIFLSLGLKVAQVAAKYTTLVLFVVYAWIYHRQGITS